MNGIECALRQKKTFMRLIPFMNPVHTSVYDGPSFILYIKTEFVKVCSGLGIFQVAKTPQILTVLVP